MSNWVKLPLDEVPEAGSKAYEVTAGGGVRHLLFVVRKRDQLYAYRNRCPHIGVTLEWMPDEFLDVDRDYIQCAMHGALFAIEDGLCLRGPCLGQSLQSVPLARRGGEWFIDLDSAPGG